MSHLITVRPGVDSDLAAKIANALEDAGLTIADGSLSECGLVLSVPDHPLVAITFSAVETDSDDRTPDRASKGRRDDATLLQPISGGSDQPFEPTPADWEALNDMTADTGADSDFPAPLPGSGVPVRDRHSPEALANIRRLLYGA